MKETEHMPDWSGILPEMLAHIASFLTLTEDFMALRGVCTSWRAAAAAAIKAVSKVPLLMLGENDGGDDREFYSLSKRKICIRTPIPGTKGNKCIDAGFGWILAIAISGEVWLQKPFSSAARIQLPDFETFPRQYWGLALVHQAMLTANPSETSRFVLVVVSNVSNVTNHSGSWKPGDGSWTDTKFLAEPFCCYKGKIYQVVKGYIRIWDPYAGTDFIKSKVHLPLKNTSSVHRLSRYALKYLVESTDGELLLIIRFKRPFIGKNDKMHLRTTGFIVVKVDLVEGKCKTVDGLGRDAIFVGNNVAVSVAAADFPGVLKPNCIYFIDDCPGSYVFCHFCGDSGFEEKIVCGHHEGWGSDTGIYNVEGGITERFDVEFTSRLGSPQWIFPSFWPL